MFFQALKTSTLFAAAIFIVGCSMSQQPAAPGSPSQSPLSTNSSGLSMNAPAAQRAAVIASAPRKLSLPKPAALRAKVASHEWKVRQNAPRAKRPVYTLNAEELIGKAKIGDPRIPLPSSPEIAALTTGEAARASLHVGAPIEPEQTAAIDKELAALKDVSEPEVMTTEEEELERRFQQLLFEAEMSEDEQTKLSFNDLAFKKELAEQNAAQTQVVTDKSLYGRLKQILLVVDPENFRLNLKTVLVGLTVLMGIVILLLGVFIVRTAFSNSQVADRPFLGLKR